MSKRILTAWFYLWLWPFTAIKVAGYFAGDLAQYLNTCNAFRAIGSVYRGKLHDRQGE